MDHFKIDKMYEENGDVFVTIGDTPYKPPKGYIETLLSNEVFEKEYPKMFSVFKSRIKIFDCELIFKNVWHCERNPEF